MLKNIARATIASAILGIGLIAYGTASDDRDRDGLKDRSLYESLPVASKVGVGALGVSAGLGALGYGMGVANACPRW